MVLDINKTRTTNYSDIAAHTIDPVSVDTVQNQEETRDINERWLTDWAYFNRIPKLKSAILMKAIWTVGKGFTADKATKMKLELIRGNGKQTFQDILFNMVVCKQVGRDSYAEIIREEDSNRLLNLKIINPGSMTKIFGRDGRIKRYEQTVTTDGKKSFIKFTPDEIFHLSHNCFAGEMHGRSVPEAVEDIILADDENFRVMKKLTRFQAVPFIIFKIKSNNLTSINKFKANIKEAREKGEDLIVPDDENLLSYEVVQMNPASILMEWRNSVNNQFYQAVGMPLILFGSAGSTESGGKIEYLGHETVFEHDQLEIEQQVLSQLGLKINLNSPTSLLESLRTDENKDAQNALALQSSDANAARGR